MAAGVSSSPRPAHLHHSLSRNTNGIDHCSSLNPSNSFSTTPSSPASVSDPESEPSPSSTSSSSAATAPAFSLGQDYSRPLLGPNTATSSPYSTPATSPIPTSFSLEPVAETTSSSRPESSSSSSLDRHKSRQQPLIANFTRGELKSQRSGGFFAFAASALDRTQTAIATISDPNLRHKRSLSRLSTSGDFAALSRAADPSSPDKASRNRPASILPSSSSVNLFGTSSQGARIAGSQPAPTQQAPYSKPYSKTDASLPPPLLLPRHNNTMHQTSSRLLRMTDDDRPFTKVSHSASQFVLLNWS